MEEKIENKIKELQQTCKECHFRCSLCKDKVYNLCTIQVVIKNLQDLLS